MALALMGLGLGAGRLEAEPYPHRWFYYQVNLAEPRNLEAAIALADRAARAGLNGMVLADAKFMTLGKYRLDDPKGTYAAHVRGLLSACGRAGIEVIPAIQTVSKAHGVLVYDPNLAEGFEVRDAVFEVRGGQARVAPDPAVRIADGGFESFTGPRFTDWRYQDDPGKATLPDPAVRRSGRGSIRLEPAGAARLGQCRINQRLRVKPHRYYRVRVWLRTEGLQPAGAFKLAVSADANGQERPLTFGRFDVRPTQEWTPVEAFFNSMGYEEVTLHLGLWRAQGGRAWLDDAEIAEAGLLNVLRRPGCPLTVRGEDGKTTFVEGRDFARIEDRHLGVTGGQPGVFNTDHEPPTIRLLRPLPDGTRLRVSFYHALTLNGRQVDVCLTEPEADRILEDQVRRLDRLLGSPKRYLLGYDELRQAGSCAACKAAARTPGELLAGHVRRTTAMMRRLRPDVELMVWNDMFDPTANARKDYYLVDGTLEGSWAGLPGDVLVCNWSDERLEESLKFFDGLGLAQIVSVDYDRAPDAPARTRAALGLLDRIGKARGTMYTTWTGDYRHLEEAGRLVAAHPAARPIRRD